jgi:hypothetical protein
MFQMRVFFFATCERVFVRDIMSFVTHVLWAKILHYCFFRNQLLNIPCIFTDLWKKPVEVPREEVPREY